MRFCRVGSIGQEVPAVAVGECLFDLRPLTRDIDGWFLETGAVPRVEAALAAGTLPEIGKQPERYGPPIARPMAVICIGQNYAAHAAESGSAPPSQPIVFFKHPNTVVGAADPIVLPPGSKKLDWEIELGVVIGRQASYLASPDESPSYIAGYVVSNDVSERDYQIRDSGGQWSKGKTSKSFNPLGPYLVTPEEFDPRDVRLWSLVNGEARQNSSTVDMIFGVNELVHHLSQFMVLEPGDLINTGTPQGVALSGRFPFLSTGDIVEVGIEGLGKQRSLVVDEG